MKKHPTSTMASSKVRLQQLPMTSKVANAKYYSLDGLVRPSDPKICQTFNGLNRSEDAMMEQNDGKANQQSVGIEEQDDQMTEDVLIESDNDNDCEDRSLDWEENISMPAGPNLRAHTACLRRRVLQGMKNRTSKHRNNKKCDISSSSSSAFEDEEETEVPREKTRSMFSSSSTTTTLSSITSTDTAMTTTSDEGGNDSLPQHLKQRKNLLGHSLQEFNMVAYAPPPSSLPDNGRPARLDGSFQAKIVPTVTNARNFAKHLTVDGHYEAAALYRYANGAALGVRSSYRPMVQETNNSPVDDVQYRRRKQHNRERRDRHRRHHHHYKYRPEKFKALVAMLYFFLSTWVTAIVMVIVHDRVPDMDKHPPLPDIILDNLPLIPWAFGMCEACALVLFFIWAMILTFHKHRFILIRRMFSLCGTVFLLRCVTMLITSMSVPGKHLKCEARAYDTWPERLHQAYLIWQGGGMSIQGVRTCGDYMFSGHTVVLTMLNFFITEYTPPSIYYVHTVSWVLNLFGAFFILAGHEHYSIDVFIAFYITTRLFLYYHTLANNRALYQRDRHRTRIWFPLFSYFESGVHGIVPNEYEIPFRGQLQRWLLKTSDALSYENLERMSSNTAESVRKIVTEMREENGNFNVAGSTVSSTSSSSSASSNEQQQKQMLSGGEKIKVQ